MKKLGLLIAVIAMIAVVACSKKATPEAEVDAMTKQYLYSLRDGKIDEVYNTMLSKNMKAVFTIEDFKEHAKNIYKNKVGTEIRTSGAKIDVDKATGKPISAVAKTANWGRMASATDKDESLKFTVRMVKEGEAWKIEQEDYMLELATEKGDKQRLEELLKNYKGLIKLEEVRATKTDKGMAKIEGTILNGSEDLDLIKIGVKLKFKDNAGDFVYIQKFYPVTDMRFEGLRTSVLPGEAKVFELKVKDLPETWDSNQPLDFEFYMIDGAPITKEELTAELADRAIKKKEIEEARRADSEAQRQIKEMWEREKKLKEKIKALKATGQ